MNKKQYLTSLFNNFQDENIRALERFYNSHPNHITDIALLFPYLLAANYYYIPGFQKDLPSLSLFHFRMNEHLKNKISVYLNVKDVKPVTSSTTSDIISIYIYDDISLPGDINFIVFYDSENISVNKSEYLKEKTVRLENWFKNRFKAKVNINLFSEKNRTLFKLKGNIIISIFDFYSNAIHLEGKYTYRFLLNKKITALEFLEEKRNILLHNWLNESVFFSLPHFKPSKEDLIEIIKFYLNNTLKVCFTQFHKLLYYHSLHNAENLSDYFKIFNEKKLYHELNLIKKESTLNFNSTINLSFAILLQDKGIPPYTKDKIKSSFMLFESLKNEINDKEKEFNIIRTNSEIIKLLNFLFTVYKTEKNPVYRLLKNFNGSIEFHNFLNYSFMSDKLTIMYADGKWGLYHVQYNKGYQKQTKLYSKNSLIELLIFSIYNKYIINSVPTIKNKSNNILDENNYFNRLKNKLIKYNIAFDTDKYLQNSNNYAEEIESIFIFLNFSINGNDKKIKDYSYVSEQWDPLNYGYNKKSNINEIAIIIKTLSQKIFYYEYYSDEAVLIAIKNLFSKTFKYNDNLEITINIFDSILSSSVIFRLKKLFKEAYKIFSYKNSMLLTSYNGTISLLRKNGNNIDILPYKNEEDFFNMLTNENSITNYKIDEDVLELKHFSMITENIYKNNIDIFFMVNKKGNRIYIFDEENLFYFFKNISLNFLANIVELAINHQKHIETVKKINLFNIDEKEINDFELIPISVDNLRKINKFEKKYMVFAEGSIKNEKLNLSYKINGKVFSYEKFKENAFFKMIKFVKLSNLDKIKLVALHTSYFENGKRYYSFKYKLKAFKLINAKIKKMRDSL